MNVVCNIVFTCTAALKTPAEHTACRMTPLDVVDDKLPVDIEYGPITFASKNTDVVLQEAKFAE